MDEPHRSERHCSGVIYVDADTEYNVHIDALPHKTGLWRCSGGLVGIVTQVLYPKPAEGNINDCTWLATSPRWLHAPMKKDGICVQNGQKSGLFFSF